MNTRMSKYYNENVEGNKRSVRNVNLYDKIYEEVEYSNIEGIATIEKTNEIDLNKIKELLKEKDAGRIERRFEEIPKRNVEQQEEKRIHDIKDVLSKARDNRNPDNLSRSLSAEKLEILKSLSRATADELKETRELKDLVHTMTNTKVLTKMGDEEIASDMFFDLVSSGNTVYQTMNIKAEHENELSKEDVSDKSFYTSSLNFDKKDFEEETEDQKEDKGFIKMLVWMFFITIGIVFVYLAIKFPIV